MLFFQQDEKRPLLLHAAGDEFAQLAVSGEEVDVVGTVDGAAGVLVENEAAELRPAGDALGLVEDGLLALDPGQGTLSHWCQVFHYYFIHSAFTSAQFFRSWK